MKGQKVRAKVMAEHSSRHGLLPSTLGKSVSPLCQKGQPTIFHFPQVEPFSIPVGAALHARAVCDRHGQPADPC